MLLVPKAQLPTSADVREILVLLNHLRPFLGHEISGEHLDPHLGPLQVPINGWQIIKVTNWPGSLGVVLPLLECEFTSELWKHRGNQLKIHSGNQGNL